jgi:hypothetical protein
MTSSPSPPKSKSHPKCPHHYRTDDHKHKNGTKDGPCCVECELAASVSWRDEIPSLPLLAFVPVVQ